MSEFKAYPYTEQQILDRIETAVSAKLSDEEKKDATRFLLSIIDLTTLEATDTDNKVTALCDQAKSFSSRKASAPNVAAVCVYPPFAALVKKQLQATDINTACVATAFPSGQSPLVVKLMEVSYVVMEGADEVDMVISRGKFLESKYEEVSEEIMAVKAACGDAHLKVILETGELKTIENIRKASEIAILAGADFIKTSTGKIQPAATEDAFLIMLDTIKEYYELSGKKIGIKAAGGIADTSTALRYYMLVKEVLGEDWLHRDLFRIGASRLAENIFSEL